MKIITQAIAVFTSFLIGSSVYAQNAFNNAFNQLGQATPASLDTEASLPAQVGFVLNMIFGILGLIALIIVIHAGFHYLVNAGDPEKIKKAKMELLYAVIGIAVILAALSISNFVVGELLSD